MVYVWVQDPTYIASCTAVKGSMSSPYMKYENINWCKRTIFVELAPNEKFTREQYCDGSAVAYMHKIYPLKTRHAWYIALGKAAA